ncbi:MAG: sigma-70 family RNA polymerase sigma factor, partial [Candidatus Latescibacterota bacterium]
PAPVATDPVMLDALAAQPAVTPAEREAAEQSLAAVRGLPARQREVTTLYYLDGYSTAEVASFLDVPVSTVKNRLRAARRRLRERMVAMVDETLKRFALPGTFAEQTARLAASDSELHQAAGLLTLTGPLASLDSARQAGIHVVEEGGQVTGAGYFNLMDFGIGTTVLRALRPAEMGGEARGVPDPAFVRSFHACFALARAQGVHLAAVHGSQYDHAFCGFVPCFYYPVVTLPGARLRSVTTRATLTEATSSEAEEARRAWLQDPYTPRLSAYLGGGVPHVVRQDSEVVGYARLNPDFDPAAAHGMPFGFLTDVTVRTREAALAVLRRAAGLAAARGLKTLTLMQSHQTLVARTLLSLGGTYRLRSPCDLPGLDAEMVAILDLAGLTRDLEDEFRRRWESAGRPGAGAALSLASGGQVAGFATDGHELRVVDEPQAVHCALPHWVTVRLYVGYYSGADVLAMQPLAWGPYDEAPAGDPTATGGWLGLPPAEQALLTALFPALWPVSWPDPDVWPWVVGQEHPRYQHGEAKDAQMRDRIDGLELPWMGR